MKRPKRTDFGLAEGTTPEAPITDEEREKALEIVIRTYVRATREAKYQAAIAEYSWANGGR